VKVLALQTLACESVFSALPRAAAQGIDRDGLLQLQETHIAWRYEQQHLYGADNQPFNYNIYPDKRGGNTSDIDLAQNQHLIVWMRPAAQPDFRKLYAVITVPLAAGARACRVVTIDWRSAPASSSFGFTPIRGHVRVLASSTGCFDEGRLNMWASSALLG
jgi:hypothetical protein